MEWIGIRRACTVSNRGIPVLSLSQTTSYAILALSCLEEGCWVKAREIHRCTAIPTPYLSKLLHRLNRAGIVVAKRGPRGGWAPATRPQDIRLTDVIEAVDGRPWLADCLLGLAEHADEQTCPLHAFWTRERVRIEQKLSRVTIRDLQPFGRSHRPGDCSCAQGPAPGRRA